MGKTPNRPAKSRSAATNTALRMVRSGLRLHQREVGVRIGATKSQVKEIENGRKTLSRSEYEEALGKLGVPPYAAPVLLGVAEVLDGEVAESDELFSLPAEARLERERAALEAAEETRRSFDDEAYALRFAADRAEAAELWQQLAAVGADRRKPLTVAARFRRWALAERLSQESVRVAPHDPHEAVSLARLALGVGGRVRGPAGFRGRRKRSAGGTWATLCGSATTSTAGIANSPAPPGFGFLRSRARPARSTKAAGSTSKRRSVATSGASPRRWC
ncbi:MAG TPA: helix-turn-helix domain-containing protein [Thermoanaerobaculia bacterium]|jgi:transcriptional regulator with XRE-family HTH domain|nr:helix-turn-helix domain-containing protein [Thermoanaerobaculia bacterium]